MSRKHSGRGETAALAGLLQQHDGKRHPYGGSNVSSGPEAGLPDENGL